ncbi:DegT/DnrJ/EryC1/StrS family aminotransferase [Deinococcus humi]|uniref:dTDP-4-amino-4,6-dideoxygalactose transaminase n=1 Tax=Deinococcus humi TaxID=662880 RepID=A0A7W8NDX4_9DEIO|nr:DegT/DnrJ/EryC1/StrS family aminotransferase [Deinococcus humi]MBB5361213.1 dTDP-4-amino-4,6-dideoxygalactose transaminase [Deinococcus humi]GGO18967.1 aminotransferase [Deinococcus humi]
MTATAPLQIPILDLKPEIDELRPEIMAAIGRVLDRTDFIMGEDVHLFEAEVAAYLGVKHAIGVNSGTDALVIALRALGIGPGDEVITTPFTFFATAESISMVGAKPVFVDIDPATLNLNPELIEAAITPATRAIMPVHLYGNPVDMTRVMEIAHKHGLKVVEDCAQSFGARWQGTQTGTIGDFGAYSFFPSKNLGAYGDGGLLATNDDALADTARMLRVHGSRKKYHNETVGYNSRLDTMQAAILRVKLPHIEKWNAHRREVARQYNEGLKGIEGIVTPELTDGHAFHQYTVRVQSGRRDEVQQKLAAHGIGTMIYYPIPQDELPIYKGQYPVYEHSSLAAQEALSLPIGPGLDAATQQRVLKSVTLIFTSIQQ